MTEEAKSFSVKDRRLFTQDGRLREESPADAGPEGEPSTGDTGPAAPLVGPIEVDFASFLMSLGAQGLDALMARPPVLEGARTMVAVLEMLQRKTEGQRTPRETETLETLLYQLRLGYVERSRGELA